MDAHDCPQLRLQIKLFSGIAAIVNSKDLPDSDLTSRYFSKISKISTRFSDNTFYKIVHIIALLDF